jgi:hypothetical protein
MLVDQNPGDSGQVAERAEVAPRVGVDHVDTICARVGDVDTPLGDVDVRMVEARLVAGLQRDEACPPQGHQSAAPFSISCRHQA